MDLKGETLLFNNLINNFIIIKTKYHHKKGRGTVHKHHHSVNINSRLIAGIMRKYEAFLTFMGSIKIAQCSFFPSPSYYCNKAKMLILLL